MVGTAGFGNSTADLDKNSETHKADFTQLDVQSVDVFIMTYDKKLKKSNDKNRLKKIFEKADKAFDKRLESLLGYDFIEELNKIKKVIKPDKINRSWRNYTLKITNYDYNFTARLPKANRIRILCMFS
jgi:hypothetical protein